MVDPRRGTQATTCLDVIHDQRLLRNGTRLKQHSSLPILIFGITIVLAAVFGVAAYGRPLASTGKSDLPTTTVQIRDKTFHVDVVASPSAREIGLSQTDFLPQDHGMLFLHDKADYYQFWMKGMKFPLDIIFIQGSTIVTIARNVPLATGDGDPPRYAPTKPADKVLEINAGLSAKYGINEGDAVQITQEAPR